MMHKGIGIAGSRWIAPDTPAKKAKQLGLNSLKQAIDLGWPRSTLVDMFHNKPERFEIVILGCVSKLNA